MNPERPPHDQADVDAEQTNSNSDQHLSSRDQRGSDKDQGLAVLDQRLSDMEQDSADRRQRTAVDPTPEDERDYAAAKRQREAVTSMRVENGANRSEIRRDRASTSRERGRQLDDRRADTPPEPEST
jgi:hypothetical protein